MRSLGTDFFRHDEKRHALVGERTGKTYRLGDTLSVRLAEAAPLTGGLRFELGDESGPEARGRHQSSRQRKGRR
jgi:ribonuclease R